ncbi:MAG: DUF3791 domain-containing protein [Candidatus Accumulibacter sp.]|jgi:hypothetical protein|nr:DUF3791 domain-containing protein [Accumulibacter sp.]
MNADKHVLIYKHAGVIQEYAAHANVPLRSAFDAYYKSNLYKEIRDGISDMHCRSDGYLAEELQLETNRAEKRNSR